MATVLDGKKIAELCRRDIAQAVSQLKEKHGRVPGLAVIIVGARPDSQTYVRLKKKAAEEVGMRNFESTLPETSTAQEVMNEIDKYNRDPDVHGILVQLPLPQHINEKKVLETISPDKDVDALHPSNIGRLFSKGYGTRFIPCTPKGIVEICDRTGIAIEGKNAVVLGRSDIVGLPAAKVLLDRNATVTICHSKTHDLAGIVRTADILVAAVGRAQMVKGDWIKPGAVVIDVGTNPVDDATKATGYRLVGDVDYEAAAQVAGFITPVPGGVGPMTIAMLLSNTIESFRWWMNDTEAS